MRKFLPLSLVLLISLAACHKRAADTDASPGAAGPAAQAADSGDKAAANPAPGPTAGPAATPATPLLSYVYAYTLSLPADRIEATLEQDQKACVDAGPTVCQLLGADLAREGRDIASGKLELRAVPAWIERYRAGVAGEAKAAGGEIETHSLKSDDLSGSIVGAESTVRSKALEHDLDQKRVADEKPSAANAEQNEQTLVQTQSELDASRNELGMLRAQAQMAKLTIDYHALGAAAPGTVTWPLHLALRAFVRHSVEMLAVLVNVLSVIAPLALLGSPLAIIAWFMRRRRPAAAPEKIPG
jgi:hypothetical protein